MAWSFGRLARARQQAAAVQAAADEQIRTWREWAERERVRPLRSADYHEANLEAFARGQILAQLGDDDPSDESVWKRIDKRVTAPNGHVQAAKTAPKIVVDDPDEWARWNMERTVPGEVLGALDVLRDAGFTVSVRTNRDVIPAPDVRDARFMTPLGSDVVLDSETGEVIPGLRFVPFSWSLQAPKCADVGEQPWFSVPPEGSDLLPDGPEVEVSGNFTE
jgi:hypothetical protein